MIKKLSLPYYLPIAEGWIIGFIPFPIQTTPPRIWTRVAVSSFNDNNPNTIQTSCTPFKNWSLFALCTWWGRGKYTHSHHHSTVDTFLIYLSLILSLWDYLPDPLSYKLIYFYGSKYGMLMRLAVFVCLFVSVYLSIYLGIAPCL